MQCDGILVAQQNKQPKQPPISPWLMKPSCPWCLGLMESVPVAVLLRRQRNKWPRGVEGVRLLRAVSGCSEGRISGCRCEFLDVSDRKSTVIIMIQSPFDDFSGNRFRFPALDLHCITRLAKLLAIAIDLIGFHGTF